MNRGRSGEYVLKLYDRALARFEASVSPLGALSIHVLDFDEGTRQLRPVALLDDMGDGAVKEWLESRTIPKNRAFVGELLAQAGLAAGDTLGIIDVCRGLSVNDAFWVDQADDERRWADVNLYENELDETLAIVAYTGYTSAQRHKLGLSTEWTTSGQFAKAWRRVDGELVLYKAGTQGFANAGMEPYSEWLAAQLATHMGIDAVAYGLERWKGKLASTCTLMNSADISLVPFGQATGQSVFPQNLAACTHAPAPYLEALRTMTVFDALICNIDRHGANYALLRDNHTGRFLGPAPLFDHNLALFPRDMADDFGRWNEYANSGRVQPRTGMFGFKEQAALVMGAKQHELLRRAIGFTFENHPTHPLPQDRLDALNRYLAARVQELMELPLVDEGELRRMLGDEPGAHGRSPLGELA